MGMNIMYGNNRDYHEFVLLLQGAAFVAILSQNYGYTLDVKSASGLKQMKICVIVTLATMLWSRLFRYALIGYSLVSMFVADGNMAMTYCGGSMLGLMGAFNCLLIHDAYSKFFKFMKMEHTVEEVNTRAAMAKTSSSCANAARAGTYGMPYLLEQQGILK